LLAPGEPEVEALANEPEATSEVQAELDAARARLVQQLTDLPAGDAPSAEIQQFIPAVMAAGPLIRLALKAMGGRDAIVRFMGDHIARLARDLVGDAAAKAIGRPIASLGLRWLLNVEAPSYEIPVLGAEALASTIEDTVREVTQLPAEAFEDPLRLEAEIQQAFSEAAARHVPDSFLRPDLPERETEGEGGVWILMPRATRPRYRYKKYTRVYLVPISLQAARAIHTHDGGTLAAHLLDRGLESWPAEAEVHLYEALPGAQLGHIAQFEDPKVSVGETLSELQPLTPEAASLVLREPGLAGPRRFYRVGLPSVRRVGMYARPHKRFGVHVDVSRAHPRLRVYLRLSEREGPPRAQRARAARLARHPRVAEAALRGQSTGHPGRASRATCASAVRPTVVPADGAEARR
jgi:hypothetical protein